MNDLNPGSQLGIKTVSEIVTEIVIAFVAEFATELEIQFVTAHAMYMESTLRYNPSEHEIHKTPSVPWMGVNASIYIYGWRGIPPPGFKHIAIS